jgi:hypothetical protein
MTDPIQRAHILDTTVWDFLADMHAGKAETYAESLRVTANALLFDKDARKSDAPIVKEGNRLAHAVLAFLHADCTPAAVKRLERGSRNWEEFRVS